MRPALLLTALVATALTLAACGDPGVGAGPGGEGTPDGSWVFSEGTGPDGGIPVVEPLRPTLHIDGEDWGGNVCNSYGGTVQVDGDGLTVTELMQTEMACLEDGSMEAEAAYLDAFGRIDRWTQEGGQLVLTGTEVELRYDPEPVEEDRDLEGTVWHLETIVEGAGPDGSASSVVGDPTLELADGRLGGHTGCNHFGGEYELDGDVLRVGETDQTLVGCEGPEAHQETVILDVLQGGPTVRVEGRTLEVTSPDGHALHYRAEDA
jgi:heat shock protein HslJ